MFERLVQDFVWLAVVILGGWILFLVLQAALRKDWIPAAWRFLPRGTKVVLLVLVGAAVWRGVPKTTNGVGRASAPLLNASLSLTGNSLGSAGTAADPARFTGIDVATNGTVSLQAYRPPDAAALAQDIVVVATTNLCTPTWFVLTNTTFAAGGTNLTVALSKAFLSSHSITNLGLFAFCGPGDTDGDGLDDWEERFQFRTDPYSCDTDGDGDDDRWEIAMGFDPCRNEPGIQQTDTIAQTASYRLLFGFRESSLIVTNEHGTVVDPDASSLSPTIAQNGLPQLSGDATRDDAFGFTWTNSVTPHAAGVYTFTVSADDVVSLSIAGTTVSSSWWTHHALDPQSVSVGLKAGIAYPVEVVYANFGGPSQLSITSSFVGDPGYNPGLEVTPHVVHVGPSGATVEGWPVASITGTTDPAVAYSIRIEMTAGLGYDGPAKRVVPNRSSSFWTDGATATAVFRLYGDGEEIASDSCTFVYDAPKEESDCACRGNGTVAENGCVHFSQAFGRTPHARGLPAGNVVVYASSPHAALYTPAVLRYDHPMMRRLLRRRNLNAVVVDGMGRCTEYRRGLPSGSSAGAKGQFFRDGNGDFVEELPDGLRVVYAADGGVRALVPEFGSPVAVEDLDITVATNELGWITSITSTADGTMTAAASSEENVWTLAWTSAAGAPVKTFTFGGDGASTFTAAERRGTAFTFNYRWTYDETGGGWTFEKGFGSEDVVREERSLAYDASNRVWTTVQTFRQADGTAVSSSATVLDRNGHALKASERRDAVSGKILYAATLDADGRVAGETDELGRHTAYTYDALGRVATETATAAGVPTTAVAYEYTDALAPADFRPARRTTSVGGLVLFVEEFEYGTTADGNRFVRKTRTAGGVARTSYEEYDAFARPLLSVAEDGRAVRTVYADPDEAGAVVETEDGGAWIGSGFALVPGRSTREVRTRDARGDVVRREAHAFVDGAWHLLSWSTHAYDAAHRETSAAYSDGTSSSAEWICTGPVRQTGRDGVTATNAYNAAKQLASTTRRGPFGDVATAYARDAAGRIVRETTTAQGLETQTVTRSYDSRGRVVSETDAHGATTSYAYSADDLTTTVVYANGGTRVTTRNPDGSTASVAGTAVTPEFHAYSVATLDGVPCRVEEIRYGRADSPRYHRIYADGFGQTVREERSGANGSTLTTSYAYDIRGNLVERTETGKPAETYVYDAFGDCTNLMQTAGTGWRRTATAIGNILLEGEVFRRTATTRSCSDVTIVPLQTVRLEQLSGLTLQTNSKIQEVDARGNMNSVETAVDPARQERTETVRRAGVSNVETTLLRDGRPVSHTSQSGVMATAAYDAYRRETSRTDGRGNTTQREYDARGFLQATNDALNNRTSYVYSDSGEMTGVTNALGGVTEYEYDVRGNKICEHGATYPVRYGYDVYGNRVSMTTYRDETEDAAGDTTTWTYDESTGLLAQKRYADNQGPSYTYFDDGRLHTRTWARGVTTTYAYDAWGSLTNTVYSDGTPSIARTYDALGRPAAVSETDPGETDAADDDTVVKTESYSYDAYGDKTQIATTGIYAKTLVRHYDAHGRDTGHTLDGTRRNTITYDAATGRIAGETIGGHSYVWTYLQGTDLKARLDFGTAGSAEWTYETSRDLLAQVRNAAHGSVVSQHDYTNDALGRRTQIGRSGTMMSENRSDAYGYNARGELLSAAKNGVVEYAYAYDGIGNRTSSTEPDRSCTYTANSLNQYTAITPTNEPSNDETEPQTFVPAYDADGNQTCVKTSTGVWQITYNGENRPISWSCGTTNLTMKYDYRGRRIELVELVGGNIAKTQRFVYDGYLCIQRLGGTANTVTENFEWDPTEPVATRPLYMQACTTDGTYDFFYTHDGNKNVSELVSFQSTIGVAAHYEYAPFGCETFTNNGDNSNQFNLIEINPWRFACEFSDCVQDLIYFNYRYLDPFVARWNSRDPLGSIGGVNLYSFNENNAINVIDELGLVKCYRWMLISFYSGQPQGRRSSWQKDGLDDNSAATGLRNYTNESGRKVRKRNARGSSDFAYPPGTQFIIYRGRKKDFDGDSRTIKDGGSGWADNRIGLPGGVDADEWLDLWVRNDEIARSKGLEVDLVSYESGSERCCQSGWSDNKNVHIPEKFKRINDVKINKPTWYKGE